VTLFIIGAGAGHETTGAGAGHEMTGAGAGHEITGAGAGHETTGRGAGHEMTGRGAGHCGQIARGQPWSSSSANTLELNPASAITSGASAIKMEYLVLLVIVFLH
jgi:hypothetical protein